MTDESCKQCEKKSFSERIREMKKHKGKYEMEWRMITYMLGVFFLLLVIESLAYVGIIHNQNILSHYGWWVFYATIAVVSVGAAMWHFNSYKGDIGMMPGMMVGMTFGMQTGLMIGAIMAATNGIFVGGMTGMIAGTFIGWFNGRCCGSMGIMEGMMAGMMNGIMGGMIGTMFSSDHILWFMPVFIAINITIMLGLSYMLFEHYIENNDKITKKPIDFLTFFSYCFLVVFVLIIIMVFAPKSGLARIG